MPVVDTWHKTVKLPDGSARREKSASYGRGKRWAARYRDSNGQQKSPKFRTKPEAERHLKKVEGELARGLYVDPSAGQVTLKEFAEDVVKNASVEESSRHDLERRFRKHVYPFLGGSQLRAIRPSMIQEWIKGRSAELGDQTVRTVFDNLSMVFQAAVDDELIARNPCRAGSVKPPSVTRRKVIPWSVELVSGIRSALPARYQALVVPGAGCGLRQGEVLGLAVDDLSASKHTLHVRRQVKLMAGKPVFAPPKGGKEREVPLPGHVLSALAAHMERFPPVAVTLPWKHFGGKPVTVSLIFTSRERKALNATYVNAYLWKPALVAAGVLPAPPAGERIQAAHDKGFHQLRHHYASVMLDSGVSIRALADFLGHHDPGFTLRTYAHMMPKNEERAREAIDRAWSAVDGLRSPCAPDVRPPDSQES